MQNNLPTRKRNRLKSFDYGSSQAYFITVCTAGKECLLWENGKEPQTSDDPLPLSEYGRIVQASIDGIGKHYSDVEVACHTVMPNHVHLVLIIHKATTSVSTVIGQMKRFASTQAGIPLWQKSFYDHVIRNDSDYEHIAEYIYLNPIRWVKDEYHG